MHFIYFCFLLQLADIIYYSILVIGTRNCCDEAIGCLQVVWTACQTSIDISILMNQSVKSITFVLFLYTGFISSGFFICFLIINLKIPSYTATTNMMAKRVILLMKYSPIAIVKGKLLVTLRISIKKILKITPM